jgi:branched-chain amino acid transport system substrate-binding protein
MKHFAFGIFLALGASLAINSIIRAEIRHALLRPLLGGSRLIIRQARSLNYNLHLIGGDGIGNFALIAGPAGDGTLFASTPDVAGRFAAAPLVAKFREEAFNPHTT